MMTKQCLRILIAVFSVAVSGLVAKGQVQSPLVLTIDHPFVVAGKTLSAGTYTVKRASEANPNVLVFSSLENHTIAIVHPIWGRRPDYADRANFIFELFKGQYFLSKIEAANAIFTIPLPRPAVLQVAAHDGTDTSESTRLK